MDGHRADFQAPAVENSLSERRAPARKRITAQVVNSLRPPASGNRVLWDGELTGFGARITAAGAVSFVLRYVVDGRERRLTIGKHPDLSPTAARERATVLRGRI